jgi:DNA polymerase-3 subunit epsilon
MRSRESRHNIGMREIVLDTETTGLDPRGGDRLIEIGCIELLNRIPTGREYHCYINPERDVPAEAEQVHGLSTAFLKDKPLFTHVADAFLDFVSGDGLVIHNAAFDIGFLNAELERAGKPKLANAYVDTVSVARRKFPGQRASLDALCERFSIDNSNRVKHGALLDSELLAEVYLELSGGRQRVLGLAAEIAGGTASVLVVSNLPVRPPRPHAPSDAELAAHVAFLAQISEPLWLKA